MKASSGNGKRSKKMSKMLLSALGGGKKKKGSTSTSTNNKKRELIARVENERMKMVLKHPTFKENPVKAVLTHLAAQLGETPEDGGAAGGNEDNINKDGGGGEDDANKKKKKKRKMTPAQLRQTQGEHHAGPSERSKKSIHAAAGAGVAKKRKKGTSKK